MTLNNVSTTLVSSSRRAVSLGDSVCYEDQGSRTFLIVERPQPEKKSKESSDPAVLDALAYPLFELDAARGLSRIPLQYRAHKGLSMDLQVAPAFVGSTSFSVTVVSQ